VLRTGYVLWQAPGGVAGTGPALELLEDGSLRLWQRTDPFSVRDTSGWDLALSLTPEENDELIGLFLAVDDSDLPHDVPFAECYPRVYFEGPGDALMQIQYDGAAALSPEFDEVYAWLSSYLAANAPGYTTVPAVYCGG
jgi:hypothetical protein